jgi:S1-C subfamily serine protease
VIGINTAITRGAQQSDLFGGVTDSAVAEGLGFAIPSSTARSVASRLTENKPPAYLGVNFHPISTQDAQFYNFPVGAYIYSVVPGGPADKAGLKARDIVTKVGNVQLGDTVDLQAAIAEHSAGESVPLTVWRNGKTLTLHATLGTAPKKSS